MINPSAHLDFQVQNEVEFFAGVPDSLFKQFCACETDKLDAKHHIIAANAGVVIARSFGYTSVKQASNVSEINEALTSTEYNAGTKFLEVRTFPHSRKNIGRLTTISLQNIIQLKKFMGVIK